MGDTNILVKSEPSTVVLNVRYFIKTLQAAFHFLESRQLHLYLKTPYGLIVGTKITITKFAQPWDDPEFFIQCHINLGCDNFQGRKPFAHTMNSLRSLNPKEDP